MNETTKWQEALLDKIQREILTEIETSSLPKQLLLEKFQKDLIKAIAQQQKTFMIEMKIDILQYMMKAKNNTC